MTPFRVLRAPTVALRLGIVDTDQIIPARFLKRPRGPEHARLLFHDRRYAADGAPLPDFPLNQPIHATARILLTDSDFGVGSAREQAAWALYEFGIRAVLAPCFGDVFRENGLRVGVLSVVLPPERLAGLIGHLTRTPGAELTINLPAQRVEGWAGGPAEFDIDPFDKLLLTEGLDEFALTQRHAASLDAFDRAYAPRYPWFAAIRPPTR